MLKKFLTVVLMILFIATCAGCGDAKETSQGSNEPQKVSQKIEVKKITQEKAMEMLAADPNAKLLDCRFPKDYELRHIPGAINYPLEAAVAENFEKIPDKNMLLITYCGDGNRGGLTAKVLMEKGYTNVYMMGGIIDWKGEFEGTAVQADAEMQESGGM